MTEHSVRVRQAATRDGKMQEPMKAPWMPLALLGKRAFDILVSLGLLIWLSPAFLFIALLIKLDSRGPIFYRGRRTGKDGKPSLTFVATANAALYTGAAPVFADIASLGDLTISPRSISERIGPRTRAITVMHYGGYLCAMREITALAQQRGLSVIEDAAHAPGATLGGKMAGTFGDVGCFSFFSNKNLSTGEGGMVVTDRDDLADKIRAMRSHGMTTLTWDRHRGHAHSYDVVALGYNYRIDEIRSALGLVQLDKLERNNERRRWITAEYRRLLAGIPGLSLPFTGHPGTSSCHLFPVMLDAHVSRQQFMDCMREQGIQTSIHYPPIHQFTYYQERFGDRAALVPLTEQAGMREVTLPLYPAMTAADIQSVVDAVRLALDRATTASPSPDQLRQ